MLIQIGLALPKPVWIESGKVVGISESPGDVFNARGDHTPSCIVHMACGTKTEEWLVYDSICNVCAAVDRANGKNTDGKVDKREQG